MIQDHSILKYVMVQEKRFDYSQRKTDKDIEKDLNSQEVSGVKLQLTSFLENSGNAENDVTVIT